MLNGTCFKTSGDTFYYQPNSKEWHFQRSSGVPRYLHSTVLVGGTMIVLGGRGDSTLVSHQLMVFDIGKCDIDCNLDSSRISIFYLLLKYKYVERKSMSTLLSVSPKKRDTRNNFAINL